MMALGVNRVFTVGIMRPDAVGEEFELADFRPARNTAFVMVMASLNLLQQDQVDLGTL